MLGLHRAGNSDPHLQDYHFEAQDLSHVLVNLINKNKNQGWTEGHRNPSYAPEGTSKTDHRLSRHAVLVTKSLLQHYPMAESS